MIGSTISKKLFAMKESSVERKISQVQDEIFAMANRIVMRYPEHTELVDVSKKWKEIAPSVDSIECALNGDDCTVLNVRFGKGGRIDFHVHPENDETIFVYAGEVRVSTGDENGIDKIRILLPGMVMHIPRGEWHEIESDYAKISVVFVPPFATIESRS